MFRGRFLGFLFVSLLAVGLLGLAGSSIYRAGWTEGYFVGKVADGGETTVVSPESMPNQLPHYGRGFSPAGGIFAAIVKFFLVFFLIGMFFKFMGLLFWRRRGGWGKGGRHHWHSQWHKKHGVTPPWYDDASEEPVMKA